MSRFYGYATMKKNTYQKEIYHVNYNMKFFYYIITNDAQMTIEIKMPSY